MHKASDTETDLARYFINKLALLSRFLLPLSFNLPPFPDYYTFHFAVPFFALSAGFVSRVTENATNVINTTEIARSQTIYQDNNIPVRASAASEQHKSKKLIFYHANCMIIFFRVIDPQIIFINYLSLIFIMCPLPILIIYKFVNSTNPYILPYYI